MAAPQKLFVRSPYWMYKATQLSACVGELSRSREVRSVALSALTSLNAQSNRI